MKRRAKLSLDPGTRFDKPQALDATPGPHAWHPNPRRLAGGSECSSGANIQPEQLHANHHRRSREGWVNPRILAKVIMTAGLAALALYLLKRRLL